MVETHFQTSFIPKKPVTPGVAYRRENDGMGFLFSIAIIFVIVAALSSLGVFLYGQFLSSNIVRVEEELVKLQSTLVEADIDALQLLGAKIASAEDMLMKHTSFSALVDFLGVSTLKNVRFKDLAFEASPGSEGNLVLKGEAQSYAAVASQFNVLKNSNYIKSISASALVLDENGNVSFELRMKVDPQLFAYSRTQQGISFFRKER